MVNIVWLVLIISGFIISFFNGSIEAVTQSAFESVKQAVELCFSLIGIYSLWLGLMKIAEKSGLVSAFSKKITPLLRFIFPGVPPNSPAMGSMSMNIIANMLGLGNAATPLGLKAMQDLQDLNRNKDVASDAMIMFIVINTSSVQLIPTTVIALRSAAGSSNPGEIIGTTLIATACSTLAGVLMAVALRNKSKPGRRKRKWWR